MAASSSPVGAPRTVRAVVFDTDGVITDSTPRRAAARKKAPDARPDGRDDHRRPVDGRSPQEVVGADRTETDDSADDLRRHGADAVVADPGELLPGWEAG
ncbi:MULTISPECIES: hypothetical protein [unclassified Streptomyces]|uniref:hypothetical protein n=1 Tax=unclassified Streptomyces TaxID=2593676 RepID=UPI000CD4BF03|nr:MULTISPECIES: hypothetical protein [unclassified Streptomyces]AWL39363.1 hypothetical protein B9S64_15520 [Streptomyces sp. SM18]